MYVVAVSVCYLSALVCFITAYPAPVWHHINGHAAICYPVQCLAGTQVVICHDWDPNTTTCEPCPEKTFMDRDTYSTEGLLCKHKRGCSENLGMEFVLNTYHNKTVDNICRCMVYYQDPDYNPHKPEVSPRECRWCYGEYRYLDANGICVDCPVKIEVDTYNHKTCPIDSKSVPPSLPGRMETASPDVTQKQLLSVEPEHNIDDVIQSTPISPEDNMTAIIVPVCVILVLIGIVIFVVYWCRKNNNEYNNI